MTWEGEDGHTIVPSKKVVEGMCEEGKEVVVQCGKSRYSGKVLFSGTSVYDVHFH